jgi:hypothetical protein
MPDLPYTSGTAVPFRQHRASLIFRLNNQDYGSISYIPNEVMSMLQQFISTQSELDTCKKKRIGQRMPR